MDWEVIEAAYQRVGAGLFGAENIRAELIARGPDERAFFTLVLCGAEIDNGGVAQLFQNSTGELIYEAIAGAEHFGLERHATILREATLIFPDGLVPLDFREREEAWQALCDEDYELYNHLRLDERWYALEEELEARLVVFARSVLRASS